MHHRGGPDEAEARLAIQFNEPLLADEGKPLHRRGAAASCAPCTVGRCDAALRFRNRSHVLPQHPHREAAPAAARSHHHGVHAEAVAVRHVLLHRVVRQLRAAEARAADEAERLARRAVHRLPEVRGGRPRAVGHRVTRRRLVRREAVRLQREQRVDIRGLHGLQRRALRSAVAAWPRIRHDAGSKGFGG